MGLRCPNPNEQHEAVDMTQSQHEAGFLMKENKFREQEFTRVTQEKTTFSHGRILDGSWERASKSGCTLTNKWRSSERRKSQEDDHRQCFKRDMTARELTGRKAATNMWMWSQSDNTECKKRLYMIGTSRMDGPRSSWIWKQSGSL